MLCDNEFCVYNRGDVCIIENVCRDRYGDCGECITVVLDRALLEAEKERQLLAIEARWAEEEARRACKTRGGVIK